MKVVAGRTYLYVPNLLDQIHVCAPDARPGDLVRVVRLRSAPPPNTMGQCHIESMTGDLLGMVSTNSLYRRDDEAAMDEAIRLRRDRPGRKA